MAAQIRVYLTPEEAEHGTSRMVRPAGGRWVEVSIPPVHHDDVIVVNGEVRVRVVVVPSGIDGVDSRSQTGWHASARVGAVVLIGMLALIAVLLVVRGCAAVG
ncbi:MAG TPA: hypothetical protein VGN81_31500 [Pseudonocardiaceae bacterium]|jgi:hypothetical protein